MRAWIFLVSLLRLAAAQEALPPGAAQALQSPFGSLQVTRAQLGPDGRIEENAAWALFEGIATPAAGAAAECALVLMQIDWDHKLAGRWLRFHRDNAGEEMPGNPMLGLARGVPPQPDPRLGNLATRADLDTSLASAGDDVRARVAPFAGAIGSGSPTTIAALVSCLASKSSELRWRAAWAIHLSAGSAAAREAVPALHELLADRDQLVRAFAAAALAKCAPRDATLPPVVLPLCDGADATVARVAIHALGLLALDKGRAVEPLMAALKRHGLPEAARSLGACGEAARPAVSLLIMHALGGPGPLGDAATSALKELRVGDEPWIAALLELCDSNAPMVQRGAALRLGTLGARAKPATKKLLVLLASDDHYVRIAAVSALAAIGPDAAGALPQIEKIFAETGAWSRMQRSTIASCVAGFGSAAIPLLELASKDGEGEVREAAIAGLARLRK